MAFAVWCTGLGVATLAPSILAAGFWYISKTLRFGWLADLLLVPATYAVVSGSITLMLLVAGEPDRDGPTGWATDPAVLVMLVCPAAYYAALTFKKMGRRRTPENHS